MKKIKLYSVLLFVLFVLISCGDDDGNNNPVVDPDAPVISKIGDGSNVLSMETGYTITGLKFGTAKGKVILGEGVEASITRWRDTAIGFSTPLSLVPGELYIITSEGKHSNKIKYTVSPNSSYPVMISINGGSFKMGNNSSEENSEKPEHTVTVNSFYISETEVTQKQYREVMTTIPKFNPDGEDYPANYVRFNDAARFCNNLSKIMELEPCYTIEGEGGREELIKITCNFTKNGFRLPTDAEWEYAARAGSNLLAPSPIGNYAWFSSNAGASITPFKVRQKQPNAFGLYDMNGNVEEWVWDWYSWDYYGQSNSSKNPTGPSSGETRIARGGSYRNDESLVLNTSKVSRYQVDRQLYLGFRVVRNKTK